VTDVPYGMDLFNVKDGEVVKAEIFRKRIMMLMFLTKSRPDIKLPVVFLSTRMHKPTAADHVKLNRIAKYVNSTRQFKQRFSPSSLQLYASSDASFKVHSEMQGHSGAAVMLGKDNAPFMVISKKQGLVTRSSAEAELVALGDGTEAVLWAKGLSQEVGLPQAKIVMEQDNQSTIKMVTNGPGRGGRSKAIDVRLYWVRQYVQDGSIELKYKPSAQILADGFTKPLPKKEFLKWRDRILNVEE
jgi:hypothetical protein